MNSPFFNNANVTVAQPIVTRQTQVVNRYFVIEQPHICEMETQYVNHYVKRHKYIPRPLCCEKNVYSEENCGCCPGMNQNFSQNLED